MLSAAMRVAHVTISHSHLDVRIFHKQARTLAAAGHEVHVVAPGRPPADREGVRFHGLPAAVGLETAYLWDVFRHMPEILRVARRIAADVYHMPDPALIPMGLALRRHGARIVYDAHEDRPRQALTKYRAHGRPAVGWITAPVWGALEAAGMRAFDHFITATPAIARRFPADRTTVVHNFPRREEFAAAPAIPYADRRNDVVYSGGITRFMGVAEAIAAIELVPERLGARLIILGDTRRADSRLMAQLESRPGWARVVARGHVPRAEVATALAQVRAGLALYSPRREHRVAMGNKPFEYMAAGLPVIAPDYPVWRRLIADAGAGLTVDPTSPAAIAAAVTRLLDHPGEAEEMGRRGAARVAAELNWDLEAERMLAVYDTLARG
jgi:glycosyltransferase involved in cell wall biosynthesis